ncbi:MAG: VOC family protein, partial [Mesorhizobium sp.]
MSELPFAATTPVSVSRVGLKARDAEGLAAYYRAVVGLQELSRADGVITLGAANRPLLVLEPDAAAKPDDPRSAGLFHTAFLLPSRADLGRWINHAAANRIAIEGASDHLVSEALYMTDPEG